MDDDHLDLLRFDDLATRARQAQDHDPASAFSLFEQALHCWRAPLLADLPIGLRLHPVAVAVSARRLAAALRYADLVLALDCSHEQVVDQLRSLVRTEPLHEGLHARLMLALAGSGQQAAALRLFTEIRGRLADELGVEPGSEIKSAHLRIVRQDFPAQRQGDYLAADRYYSAGLQLARRSGFSVSKRQSSLVCPPFIDVPVGWSRPKPIVETHSPLSATPNPLCTRDRQ